MPIDNAPRNRAGIVPGDGEPLKWDSSVTATDGPLVVYESGHDGYSLANDGVSVAKLALATALTNHHGRLLYSQLGSATGMPARGHRRLQIGSVSTSTATYMDPVYLSDTGTASLTAGTVPKVIGYVQAVGAAQTAGSGVGGSASTGAVILLCQPDDMPWVKQQRITAASTELTGTVNTAQTFDKSLSIPSRRAFNGVRAYIRAVVNNTGQNGTDNHTYTLRVGGVDVASTGAFDPAGTPGVSGTKAILEAWIEVRATPGATAAAQVTGRATFDSSCVTSTGLATNATLATNAAITVDVQTTFAVANTGNKAVLQSLTIDYIDPV